jgi:hypothetical protein
MNAAEYPSVSDATSPSFPAPCAVATAVITARPSAEPTWYEVLTALLVCVCRHDGSFLDTGRGYMTGRPYTRAVAKGKYHRRVCDEYPLCGVMGARLVTRPSG